MENVVHAFQYHGNIPEADEEHCRRTHQSYTELRAAAASDGQELIPPAQAERVMIIEQERHLSLGVHASLIRMYGSETEGDSAAWARARVQTGAELTWAKGTGAALAGLVATMQLAGIRREEQLRQLTIFQAECEQANRASSTPSDRNETRPAPPAPTIDFTTPDPTSATAGGAPATGGATAFGSMNSPPPRPRPAALGESVGREDFQRFQEAVISPLHDTIRAMSESFRDNRRTIDELSLIHI